MLPYLKSRDAAAKSFKLIYLFIIVKTETLPDFLVICILRYNLRFTVIEKSSSR